MSAAFDIAVVGGGAAGLAAAVSAARAGCATVLLDRRAGPGGTGGFSGLTTLCGLFDDAGNFLNDGFPREFADRLAEAPPLRMGKVWVLPYRPEKFRAVAAELLAATPKLQTRWNTPLAEVVVAGARIVRLNGFRVGAVIDCSGNAEVARAIGAECLATDATTQSPAVIFPLAGVTRKISSPADAAQVLLPLARAGFPPLSFQPSLEPDTLTLKFSGPAEQVPAVLAFLRAQVTGFENCRTPLTELTPAHRAGRMILGQYVLTGADVLGGRKFPDVVARGAWPIEQWGVDGVARFRYLLPSDPLSPSEGERVRVRGLAGGTDGGSARGSASVPPHPGPLPLGGGEGGELRRHYEIPARSLRAAAVENLFTAGKTISADADAIASARVMGCCLATGAAAGALAARYLKS